MLVDCFGIMLSSAMAGRQGEQMKESRQASSLRPGSRQRQARRRPCFGTSCLGPSSSALSARAEKAAVSAKRSTALGMCSGRVGCACTCRPRISMTRVSARGGAPFRRPSCEKNGGFPHWPGAQCSLPQVAAWSRDAVLRCCPPALGLTVPHIAQPAACASCRESCSRTLGSE